MGPWIRGLLKGRLPDGTATSSYYHVDGEPLRERKVWLQDDYVKFIRLSQWLLDDTGTGVHGYITNHGYLTTPRSVECVGPSCVPSAESVCWIFTGISRRGRLRRTAAANINVFDIQQGVAVGLFTKAVAGTGWVYHADLWGEREQKCRWLWEHGSDDSEWGALEPRAPFHLFEPSTTHERAPTTRGLQSMR